MAPEIDKFEVIAGDQGLMASLSASFPDRATPVQHDISAAAIGKIVLTLASLWLLIRIFPVIILVTFSLMLVATFDPMVRKLQARLGRSWAIVGVVTGMVVLFLGTLAVLIPPLIYQGYNILQHAPQYTLKLQQMLAAHHIHVNILQQVEQLVGGSRGEAPEFMAVLSSTMSGLTAFATVAILTIYFLIEGPKAGLSVIRLLPRQDR